MASIKKRSDTSYLITVSCGYDKAGKKITKTRTINVSDKPINKRYAEAQRRAALFEDEIKKGQFVDNERITFEEFTDIWLRDYAHGNLQPRTAFEYKLLLSRIIPAIGHLRLLQLQPTHLNKFYNNLREDGIREDGKEGGLSEQTILHHHRLISTILNCAIQWGFLLSSPASRVKAPKISKKEARHYDIEKTDYILHLLEKEPHKYRTMITLALYGGMREGELNALTWSDVDPETGLITISKSLQHLPDRGTFVKSTKTENTRVIHVSPNVIGLLNEHKKWQNKERLKLGNLWKDSDNIFTANDGSFIYPSTVSKWFLKFIRRHNDGVQNDSTIKESDKPQYMIPEVNFHGLRHTSATLLISLGTDVSTVSKRLGHARTSTTMDIYSHSLQKSELEASNKLDNLFNKKVESKKQG
jgi:integrase